MVQLLVPIPATCLSSSRSITKIPRNRNPPLETPRQYNLLITRYKINSLITPLHVRVAFGIEDEPFDRSQRTQAYFSHVARLYGSSAEVVVQCDAGVERGGVFSRCGLVRGDLETNVSRSREVDELERFRPVITRYISLQTRD